LLALATLLVLGPGARAESPRAPTIAVLPFQVFNAPDLVPSAPGLQAALASRLALPGYRVLTPGAGDAADADWSVRTTVTRLGSRMSLDASLEPKGTGEATRRAFQTADTIDGLLPAIEALASSLREGLTAAAPEQPAPAASGPPASAPTGSGSAPAPALLLSQAFSHYRLTSPLKGEARSLIVADLDRDGTPEILCLVDGRVVALRDDGRELAVLWEFPLRGIPSPSLLSAGDVDGDGAPELFVAGLRDKRPATQAYQWAGGSLVPRGPEVAALVRAVVHPDRGVLLLGMLPGQGKDLFGPTQRAFAWEGGAYRPKEAFPLPMGVSPIDLDWCRVSDKGDPLLVAVTQAGALRLYDAAGAKLFENPDTLKGSRNVLVGEEHARDSGDADLFRIEGKTVTWKADDGTSHLILHKNYGTLARFFQHSATFTHGQLLAYHWDGLTLIPTGEGPKMPGFFADLDLVPTPGKPSRRTLYALLVQAQGLFSVTYSSRVLALDL
jgi:hypothetical protein